MQAPGSGRIFKCGIYRYRDNVPGLDVRVWATSEDDLIRSERSPEIGSARELAEMWRRKALADGRFMAMDVVNGG